MGFKQDVHLNHEVRVGDTAIESNAAFWVWILQMQYSRMYTESVVSFMYFSEPSNGGFFHDSYDCSPAASGPKQQCTSCLFIANGKIYSLNWISGIINYLGISFKFVPSAIDAQTFRDTQYIRKHVNLIMHIAKESHPFAVSLLFFQTLHTETESQKDAL